MAKLSARDMALVIGSGAIGAAAGLVFRLPKAPDENNLLGLIGGLVGAAIAVIASLLVLARQFETNDERHLRTVRQLLMVLHIAGMIMQTEDAALDPSTNIKRARRALATAKSVTRELQTSGPNMAAVAQLLEDSDITAELLRLSEAGIGIAPPDLFARGLEIVELADQSLERLKGGL